MGSLASYEGIRGDMAEESAIITQLKRLAEMEGFVEETPGFDRRVRQLQVIKCRELKGVFTCSECEVFEFCGLAKQVMRDRRGLTNDQE
jgi:hypothetical protein